MTPNFEYKANLVFRKESNFWVCAFVHPDGDELILGKIVIGAIEQHEKLKRAFMELMTELTTTALKDITGHEPKAGNPTILDVKTDKH